MNRFLSVLPVKDALQIIRTIAVSMPLETVPLADSFGRVLSEDIWSDVDIPGFNRSTVDGYAVRSSDTTGASESMPSMLALAGRIEMGSVPDTSLLSGTCQYIPTGASLPDGADAAVMIEYCEELEDQVLIHRPVAPGENVISKGEDFSSSRIAVHEGDLISSRVAGVLAACGKELIPVFKRPRIAIISTGNELVPVKTVPVGGQIRDVNSWLCTGFIIEQGGIPIQYGIIADDQESLTRALDDAIFSCDAVLISGGSSKGERDMCVDIIASRGEVLVHGIALSPGKPTIIGVAGSKPVIGLPGHPASAYVVLLVIVKELIRMMSGRTGSSVSIIARLKVPVASLQGREDYVRAQLEGEEVMPVFGKSGLTNTILQSNGVIRIPAPVEGYEAGDLVEVILW